MFSFDILVNGGGSVTLSFQRQPFKVKQMTVMVPWNRIVTMETVVLVLEGEEEPVEPTCPQVSHDHYNMRPIVVSTWQHTQLGACASKSTIIPESQVNGQILVVISCIQYQELIWNKFASKLPFPPFL